MNLTDGEYSRVINSVAMALSTWQNKKTALQQEIRSRSRYSIYNDGKTDQLRLDDFDHQISLQKALLQKLREMR